MLVGCGTLTVRAGGWGSRRQLADLSAISRRLRSPQLVKLRGIKPPFIEPLTGAAAGVVVSGVKVCWARRLPKGLIDSYKRLVQTASSVAQQPSTHKCVRAACNAPVWPTGFKASVPRRSHIPRSSQQRWWQCVNRRLAPHPPRRPS